MAIIVLYCDFDIRLNVRNKRNRPLRRAHKQLLVYFSSVVLRIFSQSQFSDLKKAKIQ